MIKFSLDDIKSYKLEFGDKFYLSEHEKRQNLRANEFDLRWWNLVLAHVDCYNMVQITAKVSAFRQQATYKKCLALAMKFNCKDEI